MTRLGLLAGIMFAAGLPVSASYIYSFSESWTQQQSPVTLGLSFKTPGLVSLEGDATGDGVLWGAVPASSFLACDLSAFATPDNPFEPTCNSVGLTQGNGFTSIAMVLNNAFGDPDTYTVAQVTFAGEDLLKEGTWTVPVPNLPNGWATLTVVDPVDSPEPSTFWLLGAAGFLLSTGIAIRSARIRP